MLRNSIRSATRWRAAGAIGAPLGCLKLSWPWPSQEFDKHLQRLMESRGIARDRTGSDPDLEDSENEWEDVPQAKASDQAGELLYRVSEGVFNMAQVVGWAHFRLKMLKCRL